MKTQQFEIITLDVWGNEEEGFEVNDLHRTGDFITITEEATDADIIVALVVAGYVNEKYISAVQLDWLDDGFIEVNSNATGKPVYQLIAEEGF